MADAATWYFVVEVLASTFPTSSVPPGLPRPIVGPVTQQECQQTKAALANAQMNRMTGECKMAIGMSTYRYTRHGPLRPIFEGEPTPTSP